jgi:hypothetical protein
MKGADGLTQILWRNRPDESKTPVPSVSQFNCCLGPTIKSLARVFVLLIRDLMFELRETKRNSSFQPLIISPAKA